MQGHLTKSDHWTYHNIILLFLISYYQSQLLTLYLILNQLYAISNIPLKTYSNVIILFLFTLFIPVSFDRAFLFPRFPTFRDSILILQFLSIFSNIQGVIQYEDDSHGQIEVNCYLFFTLFVYSILYMESSYSESACDFNDHTALMKESKDSSQQASTVKDLRKMLPDTCRVTLLKGAQ